MKASEKELYRQKFQAELDELKADVAKLKAKAAAAKADTQIEMNKHLKELDRKVHDAGGRLTELASAGEEAWNTGRKNVETTWGALKAGVSAAAAKLRE